MTDDIHQIARAASIPAEHRWIDADTVAAMLNYSTKTVLQRIANRPDFPRARTFAGQPRWRLTEVSEWASSQPVRNLRRRGVVVGAKAAQVVMADHAGEVENVEAPGEPGDSLVSGVVKS